MELRSRKRGKLLSVLLFFVAVVFSFAQEKEVRGNVKDASGIALPGVSVLVKGTTRGTETDFDGNYIIKTKQGETLVFSYVGMKSKEVKISTSSRINVTLEEEANELGEVIIIGYTAVKKSEFVGTATQVDMGSVENKNVSTVAQALTGEIAGVRVINTSGQPGSEPTIRIRGLGSANGNRDPLFVVDGVPFSGNIASINPEDIESTTVLKDASATAIYGARGANGVIVINTKTGKMGKDYIQLESKVGFNTQLLPLYDVVTSPEEFISLGWRALYNNGVFDPAVTDATKYANENLFGSLGINPHYNMWNAEGKDLIDPATGLVKESVTRKYTPERWRDYTFKTAIRKEYNLSMGGGSGKTTYYVGLGYLNDEGYSINSDYERYTGRLNATYSPKSWLTSSFNLGYTHSKSNNNGQDSQANTENVFSIITNMPPIYPLFLRDANGNLISDPHYGGYQYDYGERGRGYNALTNGVASAVYDSQTYLKNEVNANFFAKANIVKGLTVETRVAGQYYSNDYNSLGNPYYGGSASSKGSIYKSKRNVFNWSFLQMLRYTLSKEDHHLETFVAHESNSYQFTHLGTSKTGLVNPKIPEFNNAITQQNASSYVSAYTLESYFGQVNYDYKSKYFVSASIRRDGSSRFLNNKWGTFPSLGLSWAASREEFLENSKYVSNLKLKASYGLVGEQAGVGYYPGYNVYDVQNLNGLIAASFNRNGYPNLTWETSKMFQVGVEFGLLENRIEGSVDFYNKRTENLIFDKRLAPSTGNAIYKDNDGILLNQGIEVALTGHIINKKDFFVDLSINGEIPKNKLIQMPFDTSINRRKILDVSESNVGRAEGYSLYDFYLREWAGVNPKTGVGQWTVHYVDKNGNNTFDKDEQIKSLYDYQVENPNAVILEGVTEDYSQATQKFINKSIIPDLRGAVSLNVGYKGFTLGAQLLYSIGGYAYDGVYANLMHTSTIGSGNRHRDIHKSWKQAGDVTDVPRLTSENKNDTKFNSASTRFLTKADYFALNNVSLGYALSKEYVEQIGLKSLGFSLSADNLWITTARQGFNPSLSETGASSSFRYTPITTFTFGVKVQF